MKETVIPSQVEIKTIEGDAYSLNKSGVPTKVNVGQNLEQDSVLFTAYDAKVTVQIHGKLVTIDKNCLSCLDETKPEDPIQIQPIDGKVELDPTQPTDGLDIAAIQAAILAGEDPTEILEATAAGEGSGSANNGFVVIEYGYYSDIATTNFTTSNAFSYDNQEYIDNLSGGDASNPPATPIITPNNSGITKEDEVLESSGQLAVTNPQSNLSYTWSITGSPTSEFGTLSLNPTTGQWEYTLNNNALSVQSLANGQLITDVFEVSVSAGGNLTSTQQVTVTIVGTNDDPIISGIAVGELTEGDVDDTDPTVNETLTVADVDTLDTHTWTIDEGGNGKYGVLTINDGVWEYALDNSRDDTQALGKDDVVTEKFTIQVDDGNGGIAQQEVVITINGTNDEPVISGTSTGRVVEDLIDSADGQLTAIDADEGDSVSWSVTDPNLGAYGTFAIDSTGKWTYSIDNNLSSTQSLSLGETQTEIFEVVADDGNGGQVTHTITIDVTGTNDNPEITDTSVISGAVEHRALESATGELTFEDVDTLDNHTWTVQPNLNSELGSFSVDTSGKWTFDLNSASTTVIGLGVDETLDIVYRVEVMDNHGATDFQDVTITITGSNDGPVISGADTGSVVEDVLASVSGELTATDADENDSVSWSITDGAGAFGSLSVDSAGKWTYTLNNTLDVTQAISKDEIKTETFEIVADDGNGGVIKHTVTVEVTGTNDIPEITDSSVVTGDVAEVSVSAIGDLVLEDIDGLDTHLWTVEPNDNSELGSFSVDSNGRWNFDLNTNAAAFLALGVNETLDVIYVVQVDDQNGGLDTKEVTITVTGSNNGPIIGGTSTGSVVEDTVATASGELVSADLDTTDTATWSVQAPSSGAYGEITVDADGKWTYTIDNTLAATQSLSQGQIVTETFTVVVTDGSGAEAKQIVTIEVTGTNDLPEITNTSVIAGAVEHRVTESTTGDLVVDDVDGLDTHTWAVQPNSNADLGTFSVDGDGKWTFDLDTASASVIALGVGETLDIVYVVQVEDNHGGIDSQEVTITVTGSNDGPTISGTDTGSVVEDSVAIAEGQLEATDADTTDTHAWSVTDGAGSFGVLTVDGTGKWTYTLDNTKVDTQAISNGEVKTETFEVVVNDGKGGTETHTITIEVTGTNDLPSVAGSSVISGDVTEETILSVSGDLFVDDVDTLDSHTWTLLSSNTDPYGSIVVSTNADGSGKWEYTLNNTAAQVQALANGETHTVEYQIQVDDGQGGLTTETVSIEITGTNDEPVVSGQATGLVKEDTVTQTEAEGQLTVDDVDLIDVHGWSVDTNSGTYGSITIDPATGKWIYIIDNTLSATQALTEGQSVEDKFRVTVDDNKGGTDTIEIVITVVGTNGVPIIGGDIVGNVTEDTILTTTGTLAATDEDATSSFNWDIVGSDTGTYGKFTLDATTGVWLYTLDNDAAQSLGAGDDPIKEYYTVELSDGAGGVITETIEITINGTNDLPELSGQATGSVKEDSIESTEGQLIVDDVDLSDTHTWDVQPAAGSYGSITVDANGKWIYTINNGLDATQHLAEGEPGEDKFIVTVNDGQGGTAQKEIVISLEGTNDLPTVVDSNDTGTVIEDGVQTISDTLIVEDVDVSDTHNWFAIGASESKLGSFSIDAATGKWTYILKNDEAQLLAKDETVVESFVVVVGDGNNGYAQHTVEVSIVGTNDKPELTGRTTGTAVEDIIPTATGALTAVDVDFTDDHTWLVDGGGAGKYGTMSVDGDGNWIYALDPSNQETQALAENQQEFETFTIIVNDGNGGTNAIMITVEVLGTNDAPIIGGKTEKTITEDGSKESVSGKLTDGDVDTTDTHTWTLLTDAQGDYGSLSLNANGKWTYTIDNTLASTQGLLAGQKETEQYVIQVEDQYGAIDTVTVTVTVKGTNDIPELSGELTGKIEEDSAITEIDGQLEPDDKDIGDSYTWTLDSTTGSYGTLTIDVDGKWVYVLSNDKDSVQSLSEDETVQDTFTVTVTDSFGASTTKDITIDIVGDNDKPSITGATTGSAIEGTTGKDVATGELTAVDIDHLDNHAWSILTPDGVYGELSIDPNTGMWTYQLDNSRPETIGISSGQVVQDKFVVEVDDGEGGTNQIEVIIDIAGTNSSPGIIGDTTGEIKEDTAPKEISGDLMSGDLDSMDTLEWEIIGSAGQYGQFTLDNDGHWTYVLDDSNNTVDGLKEGAELVDIITVKVTDSFGEVSEKEVKITIEGTNDAPTMTGALSGTAIEDDQTIVEGQLNSGDPDNGDVHAWNLVDGVGAYGSLTMNSTGKWTYSLTNSLLAVQALGPKNTLTEKFTVIVTDSQGESVQKDIEITIEGTNDLPVITGGTTGQYVEDNTTDSIPGTVSGQLVATDVDAGDTTTFENRTYVGNYGTFYLEADGSWRYEINKDSAAIQSLSEGETISETFAAVVRDSNGGFVTEQIDFTIVGTNDIPIVSGDNSATVIEDAQDFIPDGQIFDNQFTKVTGNVIADDIDLKGDVVSWQVIDGDGIYGALSIDANGKWTYLLANGDENTNALNFGDEGIDTFWVTAKDDDGGVSDPFKITITVVGNTDNDSGGGGNIDQVIDVDAIEEGVDGNGSGDSGTITLPAGCTISDVSSTSDGVFGSLTVNNDGSWSYEVNDDASYVDALCEGEVVTEKWYVTVSTSCGDKVVQVNVTLTGSNDQPIIIADTPTGELGEVVEDDILEVSGQLEVVDPDSCDTHTWYLIDINGDPITDLDGDPNNGTILVQGIYGSLTLNQSTGEWTYVLDNDNPLVQALTPDQIEKEYVRVVVEDDKGAVSADSTININIIGVADDAPAVAIIADIDFKEDGSPLTQTGVLNAVAGLTPDLTWNLVTGDGSYGDLTLDNNGNWTYVLDNDSLAVQQLNEGESVTDTFSVTVVDKFGKTVVDENGDPIEMIFRVDVTGTNDAPEISGQLNGTISNIDSDSKISGNLNDGDVDTGDTHTWSVADNQGDYGRLVLINGKWTYTLDTSIDAVKLLGVGETLSDTFEVTVEDAAGETSTKTVTVTIDGSNLPPEIDQDDQIIMELKEDETITDSKVLTVTDPNGDDVTFSAKTLTGTYGTFTINESGVWTYTLDNDAAHIQGLKEGEVVSEVFTVFAVDEHGAKTEQKITVNVTGTNDDPKISGMDTGVAQETDGSTTSGNFVTSDVDVGDNVTVSAGTQGNYGVVSVNDATGKWTYTVDGNHPTVNSLSKGETLTDTVTITATDEFGATTDMTITVTINGENDAPDLVVTVPPELTEDSSVTASDTIEVTGNWDDGDPDSADTHIWNVLSGDSLGTLTFEPNGDYKLVVDNTALEIQQLGVDESLELTYTVKVTDEHGLSSTENITFTVNGTNDNPEVVNTSILSVDVEEDGTLTQSGQLDITDIDITDTTFAFDVITSPTDAYGAVTVDDNGKWTYVLDNDKAQDIGDETITETFTIQIDDGNGGVITQDVTVNITGTDDDPIIDTTIPQVIEGTVVEDGALTATGQVAYVDPEGDVINYNVINPPSSPYGTFKVDANGVWTYDLDNTLAQKIGATGAQETYTIEVTDQTGGTIQQVITINITGENDAPTIDASSVIIGSVNEDGTATAIGQLDVSDIDLTDTSFTYSVISGPNTASTPGDFAGLYGALTVDGNGEWTYSLDNDKAQALGDTVATEKFTIEVSDGNGGTVTQEITVSVTGHDDLPIVDAGATQETTGTVVEDGELHAEGVINYLDPEGTDVGYTVSTSSAPLYGTFIVNAVTGKWEYDLDNTLAQVIGTDGAQESLVIDVTDETGQVTQQVITIDITGENDSPVISGTSTADVKEGVVETVTGQLSATDIDSDPITWQIASSSSATGTYGTLSINAAGLWTYMLLEDSTLGLTADTTDEFIVEASDGKGGITQQVITVAVAVPNVIQGLSGSDILTGTTNDELLFGNPLDLSDVGTADTFTWTNASIGGDFARDVIKDFDLNSDKVDLSDIANITSVWDSASLASQIQVSEVDGSTEIYINEAGGTVQTIVIDGITLDELAGEPTASMTDAEKLNSLTNSGHLVVSDSFGNEDDNILYASGQNDILTGGGGNDIFYFAEDIGGSPATPAQTSIADFAIDGVAANGEADILDLADLLPDSIQASSTMEDMLQHIGVNIDDNNSQTVLSVTDELGNKTDITLEGVDSTTLGISDLGSMSDQDILSTIYNDFNMFKVD